MTHRMSPSPASELKLLGTLSHKGRGIIRHDYR